jgi:putative hydrolase of the HAD superfamily
MTPAAFSRAQAIWREERVKWRTGRDEWNGNLRRARLLLQDATVPHGDVIRFAGCLGRYAQYYDVTPNIFPLIKALRALGLRQAVVSNWAPSLPRFLAYHRLRPLFDAVIASQRVGISKPDIRIFRLALRALDVRPREAIFIGNCTTRDIRPSRSIGIYAIHFCPWETWQSCDAGNVAELASLLERKLAIEIDWRAFR